MYVLGDGMVVFRTADVFITFNLQDRGADRVFEMCCPSAWTLRKQLECGPCDATVMRRADLASEECQQS